MPGRRGTGRFPAVLVALLVTGCTGTGERPSTGSAPGEALGPRTGSESPTDTTPGDGPAPAAVPTVPQTPSVHTPETVMPYRATEPATPSGRLLPERTSGPLHFTQTRVQTGPEGLLVTSNVTNRGSDYLNGSSVAWRVAAGSSHVGAGRHDLTALAPGETTTIRLGPMDHMGAVDEVTVEFSHAS